MRKAEALNYVLKAIIILILLGITLFIVKKYIITGIQTMNSCETAKSINAQCFDSCPTGYTQLKNLKCEDKKVCCVDPLKNSPYTPEDEEGQGTSQNNSNQNNPQQNQNNQTGSNNQNQQTIDASDISINIKQRNYYGLTGLHALEVECNLQNSQTINMNNFELYVFVKNSNINTCPTDINKYTKISDEKDYGYEANRKICLVCKYNDVLSKVLKKTTKFKKIYFVNKNLKNNCDISNCNQIKDETKCNDAVKVFNQQNNFLSIPDLFCQNKMCYYDKSGMFSSKCLNCNRVTNCETYYRKDACEKNPCGLSNDCVWTSKNKATVFNPKCFSCETLYNSYKDKTKINNFICKKLTDVCSIDIIYNDDGTCKISSEE